MSTKPPKPPTIDDALSTVPKLFRTRLIKYYGGLKQAYVRGDLDACGSRAGKFTETLIRSIQHLLEGHHTPFGDKLNLYNETRRLENLPKTAGAEALRIYIPRALCFLYTLRNKRGFAHVGGDLDSEPVDAITCVRVADWCLCELIRVVHSLSLEEAQALVNTIATKEAPEVWSVAGKKRVLMKGLNYKAQTMLLLYSEVNEAVLIEDLFDWTEYSRMDNFRLNVLAPLHRDRLIEWDRETNTATLSPLGIAEVEKSILKVARAE